MALSLFWGIWLTTRWICACLSIFSLQKDWNSCHVNFHSFQKRESVFIFARAFFCKKNCIRFKGFPSHVFQPISTLENIKFILFYAWKKLNACFWDVVTCKKLKSYVYVLLARKKLNSHFLSFLKLAINKIHVFSVFLAFKKWNPCDASDYNWLMRYNFIEMMV